MADTPQRHQGARSALIVIDMQPDFMPGGPLAVDEGDRIIEPIARLMRSGIFATIVATQDWHPAGHISFASSHEGAQPLDTIELYGHDQTLWPDHCVQNTPGARLHEALALDRVSAFIRKGADPAIDSYSGLRNNWAPDGSRPTTGLSGYLRDRGVEEVAVCGLARDVCVSWTAQDAAAAEFRTTILWDLSRSVNPGADGELRDTLAGAGVCIGESAALYTP